MTINKRFLMWVGVFFACFMFCEMVFWIDDRYFCPIHSKKQTKQEVALVTQITQES